jgi:hypothetical protein
MGRRHAGQDEVDPGEELSVIATPRQTECCETECCEPPGAGLRI